MSARLLGSVRPTLVRSPLLTDRRGGGAELGSPAARVVPGVVVYGLERPFFATSCFKSRVREARRRVPSPRHDLVLDDEAITHIGSDGLDARARRDH